MCKWGTYTKVKLCKAKLKSRRMEACVDSCIAPLVKALNDAGIRTLASCCGHGNIPGTIILEDENWLIIADPKTAQTWFEKNDTDIHGENVTERIKKKGY